MILKKKLFLTIIFMLIISGCQPDYDETKNLYVSNKNTFDKIRVKMEEMKIDVSFLNLNKNILYRITRPSSLLKLNFDYLVVLKKDHDEYSFFSKDDFAEFDADSLKITENFKTKISDLKELAVLFSSLNSHYFHTASGNFILIDNIEYFKFAETPADYIRLDSNWYYSKYGMGM